MGKRIGAVVIGIGMTLGVGTAMTPARADQNCVAVGTSGAQPICAGPTNWYGACAGTANGYGAVGAVLMVCAASPLHIPSPPPPLTTILNQG